MKRFEDKLVVLTGAASGIGRATALRFAADLDDCAIRLQLLQQDWDLAAKVIVTGQVHDQ